MKKTTFSAVISVAILCFIFWLLITGQIVAIFQGNVSAQILIAGAAVSVGVGLFSARFFIHDKAFFLWSPARLGRLIAYTFVIFPIELIKANVKLAFKAISPKLNINPGIVKIPVDLGPEYARAMLANSITLTPGTITMDIVEEGGQAYYYVHWIDVESDDPKEAGDAIKATLENKIGGIWQ